MKLIHNPLSEPGCSKEETKKKRIFQEAIVIAGWSGLFSLTMNSLRDPKFHISIFAFFYLKC